MKPPTPAPITRAINVNGNLFTPITKGPVNPIEVEGAKYVPVNPAPVGAIIRTPVQPITKAPCKTFTLGNKTYIPLSVVPKTFKPLFLNKSVNVNKDTVTKTVITVNGNSFVPVNTEKKQNPVVVKGINYIPVKQVPKNSIAGNSTINTNG